jgi:hypothetical protein
MARTREDFARAVLEGINAPDSKRNLWALVSWMQAEGGSAKFNPLNTTQEMTGATDYNGVGVKNYVSFEQGVAATVKTLNYGADRGLYGYKPIRRRLRKKVWAYWTLRAVEESIWGTGGLALRCLPSVKRHWDYYRDLPVAH